MLPEAMIDHLFSNKMRTFNIRYIFIMNLIEYYNLCETA